MMEMAGYCDRLAALATMMGAHGRLHHRSLFRSNHVCKLEESDSKHNGVTWAVFGPFPSPSRPSLTLCCCDGRGGA